MARRGPLIAVIAVLAAAALASGRDRAPPDGQPPKALEVSFLDVGQGDATLIQDRGHAVLFDAGPPDGPISARLKAANVDKLDLLVVTHDQADHEGGAPAVLAEHPTALVLDGAAGANTAGHAALVQAADAARARRIAPERGQILQAGRMRIQILWPPVPPPDPHGDPNDRAIVATLSVGAFDLFLPADAESDVTAQLPLPAVEALKFPHHGSADPGLPDLLARLRPRVAVIEVGRRNTYGHPTAQALRALHAERSATYRTDRDGTVALTVTGTAMRVASEER